MKTMEKFFKHFHGKKLQSDFNITKLTNIKSGSRDRVRDLIRFRDLYTCQSCSKKWEKGERRFDVHHLDEEFEGKTGTMSVNELDRKNFDKMITLCHKCHLGKKLSTPKISTHN